MKQKNGQETVFGVTDHACTEPTDYEVKLLQSRIALLAHHRQQYDRGLPA